MKHKIGKNMRHTLDFITKNYGWQSYNPKCEATVGAIKKLKKIGLVKTNKVGQFRIV
jgi:hypothetical protein